MQGQGVVTRRIVIADEFDDYMRRAQITGGATISTPSLGVMQVNSPGIDDKAYLAVNLFLPRGAYVEIQCEARQDDANNGGRIGVDQRADSAAVGGTNVDYIQMDTQYWKPYKMIVPGDPKNPYTTVTFGQWKTGVGKASFRNMIITIYNAHAQQPLLRGGMIHLSDTGEWYIDDDFNRFASLGLKAVTRLSDHVHIDFIPFYSWYRPVVIAQMDNYGSGKRYVAKVANAQRDGVDIYFYFENDSAGTPLTPSTMGGCYINLLALTM